MKNAVCVFVAAMSLSTSAFAIENLYGYTLAPEGIKFQVFSGGCTAKSDFKVDVKKGSPVNVTLNRIERDTCEALAPFGEEILFSWKELGLAKERDVFHVRVMNPTQPVPVYPEF